jgi:putative protease
VKVNKPDSEAKKGDLVFLAEFRENKFKNKLEEKGEPTPKQLPDGQIEKIVKSLQHKKEHNQRQIFVRIDQVEWIKKIYIRSVDKVILNFPKRQWKDFMTGNPFIQRNKKKFIIELPKFIPEKDVEHYKDFCHKSKMEGFTHFMISQLSQIDLLPSNVTVSVNENVYSFNDAAIALFKEKGVRHWIYPFENEKKNLKAQTDRDGIVPVLFHPDLFYSRMPIKLETDNQETFTDDEENIFVRTVRDGMTIITPEKPVALFQDMRELKKEGFHNFLIDFSRVRPSQNKFNTYIKHLHDGEQVQPSGSFNFSKGIK